MTDISIALGFAIFTWWFSTGVVILLNRMSKTAIVLSLCISSVVGIGALVGLAHTANQTSVTASYCAFTSALLVWGWNELTFLTGWITGPQKTPMSADTKGWLRFWVSVKAVVWHELAILGVGLAIVAITWDAPNQVGTATYLVLWVMRTSAKLNLFFGVRNLSEAFLPTHLAYLESFFKRRTMNAFFPFAVLFASAVLWAMVGHASNPVTDTPTVVGTVLVSTLLALAIVEHLMLVLPVDTTALWRWAIRKQPAKKLEPHEKSFQVN